jgi:hypothetical protein
VEARDRLQTSGGAPAVGMFFDTTILGGQDLTQPAGQAFFYANIKDFFQRIPSRMWARLSGRPVIWLFRPPTGVRFSQAVFDRTYAWFTRDFGVRPYIVRELAWTSVNTDASYAWGVAYGGFSQQGTVAAVGPGYDESQIPGRGGAVRPRMNGGWYLINFEAAVVSRRQLLVIETWNEYHEGTDVAESVEYGRTYIDSTRQGIAAYRSYYASHH